MHVAPVARGANDNSAQPAQLQSSARAPISPELIRQWEATRTIEEEEDDADAERPNSFSEYERNKWRVDYRGLVANKSRNVDRDYTPHIALAMSFAGSVVGVCASVFWLRMRYRQK